MRGGVGAGQHGRRPRAPTFKSGRDGVTGCAASRVVTPHAPFRALARSRVGSAKAEASWFPLGGASWAEVCGLWAVGSPPGCCDSSALFSPPKPWRAGGLKLLELSARAQAAGRGGCKVRPYPVCYPAGPNPGLALRSTPLPSKTQRVPAPSHFSNTVWCSRSMAGRAVFASGFGDLEKGLIKV